jgi:hypothetical protein
MKFQPKFFLALDIKQSSRRAKEIGLSARGRRCGDNEPARSNVWAKRIGQNGESTFQAKIVQILLSDQCGS